jgi:flagella basal body P-ring formation protein FlgA
MTPSSALRSTSTRPITRLVGPDLGLDPIQWWLSGASAIAWWALCVFAALLSPGVQAQGLANGTEVTPLQSEVQALLKQQAQASVGKGAEAKPWRIEFEMGQLDPRLKLAPCDKVRAYLPEGSRMWGRTRVGLRCEQGAVRWNVYWPVTIKVWGQALIAVVPLRPGTAVGPSDLRMSEVDLAASPSPALVNPADIVGRSVMRGIDPGQAIRQDDVRPRRWFAVGETVRLNVVGSGFQVAGEGMAMAPGDEGRCARIRTENGRIVCGMPVGERLAEIAL